MRRKLKQTYLFIASTVEVNRHGSSIASYDFNRTHLVQSRNREAIRLWAVIQSIPIAIFLDLYWESAKQFVPLAQLRWVIYHPQI